MEKMPFRDAEGVMDVQRRDQRGSRESTTETNWRQALPVLTGSMVTLRELRLSDAPSLLAMLATEEVARFISPPPTTVEGFERFIAWTHRERAAGNYVCFAVVPHGMDTAIGIFQVRQLEPGFGTAEWGFAIGSAFWGTGVFMDGAKLVVDFAFDVVGTHRLEARAAVANGRGNGALRKVGAMQEGVLRKSFLRNGEYLDQTLWTILDEDWTAQPVAVGGSEFTDEWVARRTETASARGYSGSAAVFTSVHGLAASSLSRTRSRLSRFRFSLVVPSNPMSLDLGVSADADAVSTTARSTRRRSASTSSNGCAPELGGIVALGIERRGAACSTRTNPIG